MTETEQKPAVDPNLLPEEEKQDFLKQLGMANGQIEQEDFSPRRKDDMEPILEITNNAILADYLQREGLKNYREFVKVDVFNIESEADGGTVEGLW